MSEDAAQFVGITNAFVNPPGSDVVTHNGEFVLIANVGAQSVNLEGWSLEDPARARITVPSGYTVLPGGRVRVYSGPGVNTADRFYAGRRRAMLNNRGDRISLRDANGALRQIFEY